MLYDHEAFGKRLVEYRRKQGFSQKTLANKAHLSQGYIGKLETGQGNTISMDAFMNIAEALSISEDDLFIDSLNKYVMALQESDSLEKIHKELLTCSDSKLKLILELISSFLDYSYLNQKFDKAKKTGD